MTSVQQGKPADRADAWPVELVDPTLDTYSAGVIGQVPGTAATDVLTIDGSTSKMVRVTRISVSGTSTSGGLLDIQLVKRSGVDSAGTPTTLTAVPHNPSSPAATATVKTWASTPPTLGTAVGTIRVAKLLLSPAAATVRGDRLEWTFTTRGAKALTLPASATVQTLALNLNGATIQAGNLLNIDVEWTEGTI